MSSPSPLVAPIDPSGVRKGLVAAQDLLAGTLIPGEDLVFALPLQRLFPHLQKDPLSFLGSLSYDQLNRFIAVPPSPDIFPSNLVFSRIVQLVPTTSLRVSPEINEGLVFLHLPRLGRAKHSCVPNAVLCAQGKKISLRIIRHIPQSSQVFISYVESSVPLPLKQRQALLKGIFQFDCTCSACARPPSQRQRLDAKLDRFTDLMHQFDTRGGIGGLLSKGGLQMIRSFLQTVVDLVVVVVEEPFLHPALPHLLRLAALISSLFFEHASALEWMGLFNRFGRVQGRGEHVQFPHPEDLTLKGIPPPQQLRDLVQSLTTRPSTFLPPPSSVTSISSSPVKPTTAAANISVEEPSSSQEATSVEKIVAGEAKMDASSLADLSTLPPLPPSPTISPSSPRFDASEHPIPLVPSLDPLPPPLEPPGLTKARGSSSVAVASKEPVVSGDGQPSEGSMKAKGK